MDERERLLAETAVVGDELLAGARRERERRSAAGEDTAWLDEVINEMEPIATGLHDMVLTRVIRAVIDRHGSGPYTDEDIAAFAGAPLDDVRRVIADMRAHGVVLGEASTDN